MAFLILGLFSFSSLLVHAGSFPTSSNSYLLFPTGELVQDAELANVVGLQLFTSEDIEPYRESPILLLGGRSIGEIWADFRANPGNWRNVGAFVEPSVRGGISIQEKFVNERTGEYFWRHTVTDKEGNVVDGPHPRGYFSDHFGEYSGFRRARFY